MQYCLDKVKQSGSSFVVSFKFLPVRKQEAMLALYAFCREVDDVVDDCRETHVAQTTLNWWRNQVGLIYEGKPEHPVCLALQQYVTEFDLPKVELLEIIEGMQMDLQQTRYASFEQLELYCYRVAGVVGRLSARVFGMTDNQTLVYAEKLGLALQLTNILRDVGEDARRGRIYLPMDELQKFSVPTEQILSYQGGKEFDLFMFFQIDRAKNLYRDALHNLPDIDRKAQKPGLMMAAIYYALLLEIEENGVGKVLQQRLSISKTRKLYLACKTWLFGFSV